MLTLRTVQSHARFVRCSQKSAEMKSRRFQGRPNRRGQRPPATRPRSATVQLGGRRGGGLIPCTPSVLGADTTATLGRLAPSLLAGGPDPASGLPPTPVPSPPPRPPLPRTSPSWEPPFRQASAAPPPSTAVPAVAAAPFATAQSVAAMACAYLFSTMTPVLRAPASGGSVAAVAVTVVAAVASPASPQAVPLPSDAAAGILASDTVSSVAGKTAAAAAPNPPVRRSPCCSSFSLGSGGSSGGRSRGRDGGGASASP